MFRIFVCFLLLAFIVPETTLAKENPFKATEYPVPRFVSTRSDQVYVRTGPGQKYPIQWVYNTADIPVEIILEYDNWRKIKDFDGQTGWVHKTLLTGKRFAFVSTKGNANLYKNQNKNSGVMAILEPSVRVRVDECVPAWCRIDAGGYKGWLEQNALWGVYEGENFD